ncbi:hypothetical protein UFOVP45_76 [uncultured Caudovirales phage]|uniref:Uncharacterized protein n=1 Tax=uncultured Caudovirales phage TaxID=2100421 RepID=A0A6J5KRU6_9CAUD|nr:hypothetical protein UFOVP45_76 [uncultured Caudovirales phage]
MGGYEPRFDRDLERGNVGEDLLDLFFDDLREESAMFEVKTDYRVNETGNFYVETQKYRKPDASDAVPSGINGTHSKWWVQASPDGNAMLIIKADTLRDYIKLVEPKESAQPIANRGTAASKGVLIPVRGLMRYLKMWKTSE